MQIIATIVFLACAAAWYLPIYKAQGKENKLQKRKYVGALGLGFLAFPVAVIFQVCISSVMRVMGIDGMTFDILKDIIEGGILEEILKFLAGWVIIRKCRPCRKIDAILIFGMAGMGFEIIESLCIFKGILAALFRGVQALHILWLFWIGSYWWESRKCKINGDLAGSRRNLLIGFGVAIVTHALNDIGVTVMEATAKQGETGQIIAFVVLIAIFVMTVVFDIVSERNAYKTAKASAKEEAEVI